MALQLIQGGTSSRTKGKLRQAIADAKEVNGREHDTFYMFPDRAGNYDTGGFTKVEPVPLHDITEEAPWTYNHVLAMWTLAGYIKRQLEAGGIVVIACTAGKNRSPALQYAVDPTGKYSGKAPAEISARVKCPLMRRWAEAFHKSPGQVPAGIAPLVANARNPFDAKGRVSPNNIEMSDKKEWPHINLKIVKRPDLQNRILARVNLSIAKKTIAK